MCLVHTIYQHHTQHTVQLGWFKVQYVVCKFEAF
jgi:hypothetical protein